MTIISTALPLSEAVEQFIEAKRAERKSNNTLIDYGRTLRRLQEYLERNNICDPQIETVSVRNLRGFLNSLSGISDKTLLNYHIGLSSFFTWLCDEEIIDKDPTDRIKRPRPEVREIEPFTEDDVRDLLFMLTEKRYTYKHVSRNGKYKLRVRPNLWRNRALVFVLLDTGMRDSELCGVQFKDWNGRKISVFGKGRKERGLPVSQPTIDAIEEYLSKERGSYMDEDYLFVNRDKTQLKPDHLTHIIEQIGKRAGIHAHPHRFRHTFAINFLRNGGDIYALQAMLGHASLTMVKRYLAIAQADVDKVHQKASPVKNWGLR